MKINDSNIENLIIGQTYKTIGALADYESISYYLGNRLAYWPIIEKIDDQTITLEYNTTPEKIYFFIDSEFCVSFGGFGYAEGFRKSDFSKNYRIAVDTIGKNNEGVEKYLKRVDEQHGWHETKVIAKDDCFIRKLANNKVEIKCKSSDEKIGNLFNLGFLAYPFIWDYSSFFYFFTELDESEKNQPLFQDAEGIMKMLTN